MGIDGEGGGVDEHGRQHYRLMCASTIDGPAHVLFRDNGPLTPKECFEFILGLPKDVLLFSFSVGYDVTQICRQLPKGRLLHLARMDDRPAIRLQSELRMSETIDEVVNEISTLGSDRPAKSLEDILSKRVFDANDVYDFSLDDIEDIETFAAMLDANNPGHAATDWRGYRLRWLPGRKFSVARSERYIDRETQTIKQRTVPGSQRVIFDCFGFFQKSFLDTLITFKVGTPEQLDLIAKNKADRHNFDAMTDETIEYCQQECRLLAELMTKFRSTMLMAERRYSADIGKKLRLWSDIPYGAGSISQEMFESTCVPKRPRPDRHPKAKDKTVYAPLRTRALNNMLVMAYYGGRFEISRTGHIPGPIYEYDIHSAYPAAMEHLPCPLHTQWAFSEDRPPKGSLYVGLVEFGHPSHNRWCGFPWRAKQGGLLFPINGTGAYWSCEIEAAEQLFNADIRWLGGWQAIKMCDCHLYDFIPFMYSFRKRLEKEEKGSGIAFKLGPNSAYGKLCQGVGEAPFRDMVAAGLITALTRTKLLHAIALDPDPIVMCATDAVYSMKPLALPISDALGDWEEKTHNSMFIVMPGVYWFPGEEGASKTRGIQKSVLERHKPKIKAAWDGLDKTLLLKLLIYSSQPHMAEHAPYPYTYISAPTFTGLRLALSREQSLGKNDRLRSAGVWQIDCEDEHCDHQECGKRLVSFDWRNKRQRGKLFEWQDGEGQLQRYVEHGPITASRSAMSTPAQRRLLTLFEDQRFLYEAMPDLVEQLHEASEFSRIDHEQ